MHCAVFAGAGGRGEDLTAPILPSERSYQLNDKDVGRSARLDMQKALDLAEQSRTRVR